MVYGQIIMEKWVYEEFKGFSGARYMKKRVPFGTVVGLDVYVVSGTEGIYNHSLYSLGGGVELLLVLGENERNGY